MSDGLDGPSEPPRSVEDLRDLLLRISRGEAAVALGPKAREALGRILELRGDPALLSITTLGRKLGINPSTLTRLAQSLGYTGFGAFQEVLLNASLSAGESFYTRQARVALEGKGAPGESQALRLCRENQANIDHFIQGFDRNCFDEAVGLITQAPRVSVHGIRQFHAFASFLVYGLRMIRTDVHLLDVDASGLAEGVAALDRGDVLVSASCAPYSRQVYEVAEVAAEKGICVVAVTDRADSPLVKMSRTALFVPHETSFLSNSLTTFILAAECLINGCASSLPDRAKAALEERDRLIKRMRIEF
ncbi:MAG: MurR/RpiR family transcriptional regulator [Rhodospirillum sp.]|nr:MurR/RpiR family transcriptional regulator [Rhodospirillum sp.]MCF8488504.1 MurR/RpiR family transcriptional regulator [Rhodospirillum sp.]MCF8499249.1 MurR/RpiR family transcriptional regulator [Rhodospirillum sp.]